ncbi:MAG: SixA phosphatase family protein [Actinomycetota bacterium]
MRRLILLRHAKSDYPPGVRDHDRPLNARGQRDAPAAGAWLRDNVGEIDVVMVSSAARAQQTWQLAGESVRVVDEVCTEPRIYEAATSTLLDVVRALPDSAHSALLVGHNPGLADLAAQIATDGDPEALGRMAMKYPTSGIAVLEGDGSWADLARSARLQAFAVPRG